MGTLAIVCVKHVEEMKMVKEGFPLTNVLLEKFPKSCNWYIIISSQNSLLEFRLVSENYYYDFCTPTKSSGERPNGKMRGSTVFLSAVTFLLHSNAHSVKSINFCPKIHTILGLCFSKKSFLKLT